MCQLERQLAIAAINWLSLCIVYATMVADGVKDSDKEYVITMHTTCLVWQCQHSHVPNWQPMSRDSDSTK